MQRRQFLASGAALCSVAAAGCAHPAVVLDLTEATPDELADEASMAAEPGSEEAVIVGAAGEDGSTTLTGRGERFRRTSTVRVDGAVYDVSEHRVGSSNVTVYDLGFDFDPADATPERGEIAVEALPAVDRHRLDPLLTPEPQSRSDGVDVTDEWGTAAELGNQSVFVPDQQYDVIVDGADRYRVHVSAETESLPEYRYEVTQIAPSVEAFAQQLRDQYLFALEGLSDDERSVVEEAIDGAYFDDDDAFQSVVDRIHQHEGLNEDDFYGTWLLEYESAAYLAYVEW
ncbi:hypothetical protein GCM10028857_27040 [Salinarchaeum chitinilyticum]